MTSVGQCENPLRLNRRMVNSHTGEFSDDLIYRRCGTRRESDCPSCSELYRQDAKAVIRAGLYGPDGKQRIATWVTLTAPGANTFGKVHSQRRQNGRVRKCSCGQLHQNGDKLLGTPINPTTYRYDKAADFNAHASRLATVTFQKLGRLLGRKIKVVRVMEYQSRGLIHVHALVLGSITVRSLEVAVRGGKNLRTGRKIAPATSGGWSWGTQCDAQVILPGSGRNIGRYMTKVVGYAVKSAGDELGKNTKHAERMGYAGARSTDCRFGSPECRNGNPYMTIRKFAVAINGEIDIVSERFRYQSRTSTHQCPRHKSATRGWGFRGHVFTASRDWGTTFGQVRNKRRQFCASKSPDGENHHLIEWTIKGRGYGPQNLKLSQLVNTS